MQTKQMVVTLYPDARVGCRFHGVGFEACGARGTDEGNGAPPREEWAGVGSKQRTGWRAVAEVSLAGSVRRPDAEVSLAGSVRRPDAEVSLAGSVRRPDAE